MSTYCRQCGAFENDHAQFCSVRRDVMAPLERAREDLDSMGSLIGITGAGEISAIKSALKNIIEHLETR